MGDWLFVVLLSFLRFNFSLWMDWVTTESMLNYDFLLSLMIEVRCVSLGFGIGFVLKVVRHLGFLS